MAKPSTEMNDAEYKQLMHSIRKNNRYLRLKVRASVRLLEMAAGLRRVADQLEVNAMAIWGK